MATAKPQKTPQGEPQAPAGPKLTPVGKLTVKTVCGPVDVATLPPLEIDDKPNPACEVRLCKLVGYASGIKEGATQYGPWQALVGEFAGTCFATGEVFAAKTCIVPGPMGGALIDGTTQALREDASAKVRFSVVVSVKRSAREPKSKYEYVVRPVIDSQLSSPALELLALEG